MALLRCVGTGATWESMTKWLHWNLSDSDNTGVLLTQLVGCSPERFKVKRAKRGFQAPRSLLVCTTWALLRLLGWTHSAPTPRVWCLAGTQIAVLLKTREMKSSVWKGLNLYHKTIYLYGNYTSFGQSCYYAHWGVQKMDFKERW